MVLEALPGGEHWLSELGGHSYPLVQALWEAKLVDSGHLPQGTRVTTVCARAHTHARMSSYSKNDPSSRKSSLMSPSRICLSSYV